LGELQKEMLNPVRLYIEKELGIEMKVNYGLETTQLNEIERKKMVDFLKKKVKYPIFFF
jgi:hypothetical protein